MKTFTIYTGIGKVLLHTDNDGLARINVLRGNRVTTVLFGEIVDTDFGLRA